jgi:hypothetical protein
VVLLFRVLFALRSRAYWVGPAPPRPRCFQLTLAVFPVTPSPAILRKTGSSSRQLRFLSRVRSCRGPAGRPQSADHLPCGFSPPSRQQLEESTSGGHSKFHHRSALGVSHALDGLLLLEPGRLVSSGTPRPRFALQGLSPTLSRADSSPVRSLLTF